MAPETLTPGRIEELMGLVARRRDKAAFALLFDHFAPRLKAFLLRQGSEAGAAEELVQEVMLSVWRRAESFDPSQAALSTWIFTIARNRRIDWLRRDRGHTVELDEARLPPDEADVEGAVGDKLAGERLKAAVAKLPSEQAEMVRLAYFEDKVHTDIAEETGLPLGTVKSRLRLALQRLRRLLAEEGDHADA